MISLGFWSMFIPVNWTVKNRTFNQTLTSAALELFALEWNLFEETFCMQTLAPLTKASVNLCSEYI
jgi:hypothetical protein